MSSSQRATDASQVTNAGISKPSERQSKTDDRERSMAEEKKRGSDEFVYQGTRSEKACVIMQEEFQKAPNRD